MPKDRFEILPHTADKEIKAFGCSMKELFENAAYGMFSIMAELDRYTPTECVEIEVEGSDNETLLHNWLSELNYRFEVDRILFVSFEALSIEDCRLKAVARGLPFSPEIEWLGSPVKAVTYGGLTIRQVGDHWEAQVIFDV